MLIQVPAIIARITRGNRHCNGGERVRSYTYTADGQIATLTLVNDDTGNQVTRWVYGTTLADSEPPPTPGLRREGSRGDEKGNSYQSDPGPSAGREPRG
jgi:hypothetical protein